MLTDLFRMYGRHAYAEYDDVMDARAQRTLDRHLAGPSSWFSVDQLDER